MADAIYFLDKQIAKDKALEMEWFKKHTDTVIVLGGILASILWMNSQFNDVKTRLTKIETVLIMQGIMPRELAQKAER
jgi:hypothetical protein